MWNEWLSCLKAMSSYFLCGPAAIGGSEGDSSEAFAVVITVVVIYTIYIFSVYTKVTYAHDKILF